jgi:UDP-N-acetylmuramyl tripeptide synthase
LRFELAAGAAGVTRWGLSRVLGRAASQLPGRVALALDPAALAQAGRELTAGSIVVTGTNGKTTTTNVMAAAAAATGRRVVCNAAGANMQSGVTAALLAARHSEWAVLEVDELSCAQVLPALKPNYLVLLNLFRDQLDRVGELDHVQDVLVASLAASPATTLVVCGDDPVCMGVARRAAAVGTRVVTFGIAEKLNLPQDRVPEARFCQVCGAELIYEYRHYAQLGAFACPSCDFARGELDWKATGVTVSPRGVACDITGPKLAAPVHVEAPFGGTYMVYNLLAAFIGATLVGATPAQFNQVLATYAPQNGRLQRFYAGGREVVLNLAKNPTGFNQNISLMQQDEGQTCCYVVVNDNDNDGCDVSWIWDVDFERMAGITCWAGGTRTGDVAVRLKYAELTHREAPSIQAVLEAMEAEGVPAATTLYVLCNYSALWPARAELERIGEAL